MDYDGIKSVVCDAEESDWLDVSYTERKYLNKKDKKQKRQRKITFGKTWKIAIVAVLCLAVLASLLFLDGDFKNEVFDAVKTATASIFHKTESDAENKINIPCNVNLVEVNEGVMTFNGGRAALSLTAGKVTNVTEDSVTVALNDDTSIVYSGLTTIYVKASDEIADSALLGKYDGQFTASILQQGQVVKQVVGSETQLTWNI